MKKYFCLNTKSLSLLRVLAALTFLCDLLMRLPHISAFYTDYGVLKRAVVFEDLQLPWKMSLFFLDGTYSFALTLFLIAIVAAIALLVGYRSRLSCFICWVMLLSLHSRNPLISHGGDNLLRMLYFWMLFLPIDRYFAVHRTKDDGSGDHYFSFFTVGFVLQICFIYWFTVYYKIDPAWTTDFSALYYAFNLDIFTTHLGKFLSHYNGLLTLATVLSIIVETFGAFLLFVPLRTSFFRLLAVIIFVGFHFGIWITLNVGVFAPACMIAWLALLPEEFWIFTANIKSLNFIREWNEKLYRQTIPASRFAQSFEGKLLAIILTTVIFLWNLEGTNAFPKLVLKSPIREFVFLLQINQQWNMFAPSPMKNDGWYSIQAEMPDGSLYDIFYDKPATFDKPSHVGDTYINAQWQKYLLNLYEDENSKYRLHFARYLCRNWNDNHKNKVGKFKIYYVRETTPPPGQPFTAPVPEVQWEHNCFN